MKKVLSLCVACLLLVGMMACAGVSVSAATPKEEIIAAAKAALPDAYEAKYLPTLENVLSQIDVTAEQADEVIAAIAKAKEAIKTDKGDSLSEYTTAEREAVLAQLDVACASLGITYKLVDAENPAHEADMDCKIYNAAGKEIGSVDADIKKTNAPDMTAFAALVAMLALAAGAAVYGKKLVASR